MTFVRELLVEELAGPWKCAVILFDGVSLATLIAVFRVQMNQYQDQMAELNTLEGTGRFDQIETVSSWFTFCVYAVASFRLLVLVIFAILSSSLNDFLRLFVANFLWWIDVTGMMLTLVTSALLYGSFDEERMLAVGTAATGLLWLALIGYLATWWHGMAVFLGCFSKVRAPLGSRPLAVELVLTYSTFLTRVLPDCQFDCMVCRCRGRSCCRRSANVLYAPEH